MASEGDRRAGVIGAIGEGLVELAVSADAAEAALGVGGDAANVCVMAAHMGARARLAGRVGDDALGRRLERFWGEAGVNLAALRRDAGAPTGLYVNEPTPGGEHRFTYWRRGSAGSRLCPEDLDERFFDRLGFLVVTGITLAVSASSARAAHAAVARARAAGARVCCVLNHRPALGGDAAELAAFARASDVLIASVEDARAVFGEADVDELARLGPGEVVISDGARPATAIAGDEVVRQGIPPVRARNAAGAGDALAGAYLASRLHGSSPAASLAWGVAAASASVRRGGCATSYPTREEAADIVRRLAPHGAFPR